MKHSLMKLSRLVSGLASMLLAGSASGASLSLYQSPLFLTSSAKANVLVILDNSNSMDEAPNGAAVGSANPASKSEIARQTIRDLISTYTGKINMGLMAYQQKDVESYHLHNSYYDISYDPAHYDPTLDLTILSNRASPFKKYRAPNPSSPGDFIYYNVALPEYSNTNNGTIFCYSRTASFDNGSESPTSGPWDRYYCFHNKIGTSDLLPGDTGVTPTPTDADAGYVNHSHNPIYVPSDSDLAQNILDFGRFTSSTWISPTWFSDESPGRGFLHVPIADLSGSQITALQTKIGVSQFTTNAPTDPAFPLQNAGYTPLEGTLLTANDYFTGSPLPPDEGGPAPALPNSCGKNFIALLTDGLPSTDKNGNAVSNPAAALSDVVNAAGLLKSNNVDTYLIGFSLPLGTNPATLNSIAAAGGTGSAYMANNSLTLKNAFDAIFNDILAKTGASSSAATNSASLTSSSIVYQARFSSSDWSGQLLAKPIDLTGTISAIPAWDAGALLNSKLPSDRVIITYGRDTHDGIPFRWADISAQSDTMQKDLLNQDHLGTVDSKGADRLDFLRGGSGGASAASFRAGRNGKLGDIIHSTPNFVAAPGAGYNDAEMPGYNAFQAALTSRIPVIYVGANDGMLHGFNATNGQEILAYVPSPVYRNLNRLTAPGYGTSLPHRYFVDGSPAIADADVGGWKTVLVSGLNAGGQGLFALDITSPSSFLESNADDIVLWEFTDEDDPDLGYTYFTPTTDLLTRQSAQIVKMNNDKWAVILGNGYNNTESDGHASSTGHGYLYILFIDEGTDGTWSLGSDYIKIDTGIGSATAPNGLATPLPNDEDGDGKVDTIYAGDLYGNLWKFDVTDSNPSHWSIAFPGNQPLFQATDSTGNPQPITSTPVITPHPNGGYMLGFGTGKYLELSDNLDTSSQTIYGIWDNDTPVSGRSSLLRQQVMGVTSSAGVDYRLNTSHIANWSVHKGWYIDLPEPGERVDVNPIIRDGRFVFVTRTPSSSACAAGGESWLMELNYLNGGHLETTPFDVNNDGVLDDSDYISSVDTNGDGVIDSSDEAPVSGRRDPNGGMLASPTVIADDNLDSPEHKILSSSNGSIKTVRESRDARFFGRLSWEEIR